MNLRSLNIHVDHPRKIPSWEIPAQRIPLGRAGDYKPNLALLPDGRLILVAFYREGGAPRFHEVTTLWYSDDGGKTWSDRKDLEDVIGREQFLTCISDGTLFLTCQSIRLDTSYDGYPDSHHSYVHRSTDSGHTWDRTRVLIEGDLRHGAPFKGHATSIARNIIELPDKTLLLWVTVNGLQPKKGTTNVNSYRWSSRDEGVTWDKGRAVNVSGYEPARSTGFFDEIYIYRNCRGKLICWKRLATDNPMYEMSDERVRPDIWTDQVCRLVWFESDDEGLTWKLRGDFGDYGQMYPHIIKLHNGSLMMTYTQRDLFYPLGLKARISYDDGDTWDFDYDQIVIEGFTPWGMPSGGGFGNTVELEDDLLVSCYSYMGVDAKPHVEVARWKIPKSVDEKIIFFNTSILKLDNQAKLVLLYDWTDSSKGKILLQYFPQFVPSKEGNHAKVKTSTATEYGGPFVAEIQIFSAKEAGCDCPGITITDLEITDWSSYAAFALKLHNPTQKRQKIYLAVRSVHEPGDIISRTSWYCETDFDPGQTRTVFATIDEFSRRLNVADIQAVSIYATAPMDTQKIAVSPIYLIKDGPIKEQIEK